MACKLPSHASRLSPVTQSSFQTIRTVHWSVAPVTKAPYFNCAHTQNLLVRVPCGSSEPSILSWWTDTPVRHAIYTRQAEVEDVPWVNNIININTSTYQDPSDGHMVSARCYLLLVSWTGLGTRVYLCGHACTPQMLQHSWHFECTTRPTAPTTSCYVQFRCPSTPWFSHGKVRWLDVSVKDTVVVHAPNCRDALPLNVRCIAIQSLSHMSAGNA